MINQEIVRLAARQVTSQMIGSSLADDAPLVSSGLIDSLSVLELIARLEESLQVRIPSGYLQPEDFDTIELMVDTVSRVAR
jgi:acyl carrier protein